MKTILIAALNQIVAQLTGRQVYSLIAAAVAVVDGSAMTGESKRHAVLTTLMQRDDVKSLGTWLINLAIEAVVAKLRSAQ